MTAWPRVRETEWRTPLIRGREIGLHFFRNPDAGVFFQIDLIVSHVTRTTSTGRYIGILRLGPGQCGEQTWDRATNDRWCIRPFGHAEPHEYGDFDS